MFSIYLNILSMQTNLSDKNIRLQEAERCNFVSYVRFITVLR